MKLFVLVLFSVSIFLPTVAAKGTKSPNTVVLQKDETVNRDYFASGDIVHVYGTVNGDAYIAGGTVYIDGAINGDLLVAGGTVVIAGPVQNDIRAAGGNVTISNTVGGNVTVGAGNLTLHENADIRGSLLAGSGNLEIFAPVGKNATLASANILLNNHIGGDVTAAAQQLTFQPLSSIDGNVTYWSQQEADILPGATRSGTIIRYPLPETDNTAAQYIKQGKESAKGIFAGLALAAAIVGILTMFVTGLIINKMFPVFTDHAVKDIRTNPWRMLGLGFFSVLLLPIAALTAFVSVIGIPIGALFLVALAIYSFLGHIFGALVMGNMVSGWTNRKMHRAWQLLIGLCIMAILTLVPLLGWLIKYALVLMGAGAILSTKYSIYKQLRTKRLI